MNRSTPRTNARPVARLFALLIAVSSLHLLAGCNTVQGVGKDLKKAGEKIEEAAKK